MKARHLHRYGTFALSLGMIVVGCALVVQVLAGSTSGVGRALLGVLFVAAGCLRTYVEVRRKRGA